MENEKLQQAKAKIQKILMDWFTSDAILLNLYSMFNFKPDPSQETFGVDISGRHPVIIYNPNFVNAMPLEHLEMIMVHTGFKILLRHCTTRLKIPKQISALASNIAIDELIRNNTLSFLANDPSLKDLVPTAEMFNLPPKDCLEEYFRQLYDRQKEIDEMIKMIWDSMTDEEKEKVFNQTFGNDSQEQQGSKQEPKQEQQQEPKQEQQQEPKQEQQQEPKQEQQQEPEQQEPEPNNDYKEYNNTNEGIKDYFDPNGTSNIGWESNDMFDADIKNYIEKNKDRVKAWGKHTGSTIEEILAALNSSFSFKDIIHKFKKSVITYQNENSRLKINRRYDLLYPGHRRKLTTRILFAIDESGSMSKEDLSYGFATINKICKHIEMDYVTFDTEIKMIENNFRKAKSTFKCGGRGGTSPECVFEYMKQSKKKYDGCIIFTDGYFYSDIKEPHFKVLWLLHSKNMKVPCKFGFVSTLDRFENTHIY